MDTPSNPTDPEIKRLLEQNLALAKDNSRILHNIRRNQVLGTVWTITLWAVALAVPYFLYQHYVQPIVDNFYSPKSTTTGPNFFGFPLSSAEVQKLIDSYKTK
jgi:hypothetical protein